MPIGNYTNQNIGIQAPGVKDRYGKQGFGPEYIVRGRLQGSNARVIDDQGNQHIADAELWVGPTAQVDAGYRINFEGKSYKVAKMDAKRNLNGSINHKKCLLLESKE